MESKAPHVSSRIGDTSQGEAATVEQVQPTSGELLDEWSTRLNVGDASSLDGAALSAGGRYEVEKEVASGGMGVVYRARDKVLNRLVALKMIRPGLGAGPDIIERFHREAQATARLNHPNIVPIHDHGWHEGRPFFTMTFEPGGTLTQRLSEFQANPRAAAAMMVKIARAVQHAHEHDILHRDLKPGNVLFDERGEPMVTDFGLAKLLDTDVELTRTNQNVGTPPYMAPEQFPGSTCPISRTTDVWAMGVLLFQMLTGQRPFLSNDVEELARQVRSADPPRPRALRPDLDPALETITLRCLEKEPDRRFPSAAELADELERWLRGEPILSKPESRFRRLRRRLRRHPVLCAAALVLVVASAGAPIIRHYLHPDRALWSIETRLAGGEEVALIPDGGRPEWSNWTLITGDIRPVGADGRFQVQGGPSYCTLELVRDPQRSSYRISADIEHTEGAEILSEVGIYFGRHTPATHPDCEVMCLLGFNDLLAWYDNPDDQPARSIAQLYLFGAQVTSTMKSAELALRKFDPAVNKNVGVRKRRRIEVEVTPLGITGFWEGAPLDPAFIPWETVENQHVSILRDLPRPKGAEPEQVAAENLRRGGLGIYVHAATAVFHKVTIRPLQ
jgi:serine/threonine-protein kinase